MRNVKITLGILAHVDAGKTTLSERILYETGAVRTFGRVDNADSVMDHSAIERERGITVFSDAASFSAGEREFTLIDTPGHSDFSPEAERAVSVLDYAIVVVSASDGVRGHTETIFRLLERYKIPTFIFINKTDLQTSDKKRAFLEICSRLSANAVDFSSDCAEALAERSEVLLEEYLETGKTENKEEIRRMIKAREIFPCFSGSALSGEGAKELIGALSSLTSENADDGVFRAKCYKIKYEGAKRYEYIKVVSGSIEAKNIIKTPLGEDKADEIYAVNGGKLSSIRRAAAGDVCAVLGLGTVKAGDVLGLGAKRCDITSKPVFSASVIFDNKYSPREILGKLKILEDEDGTLSVKYTEQTSEISISYMGKMSLQVIEYEFMRRFGIKILFGSRKTLYRETIKNTVEGIGHFEPLRHYAEVRFRMSPAPRGSGILFKSECSTDTLPQNVQNLIRTHVFEKTHVGVLGGFPLDDVEICLIAGRVHEKHTCGGDMRESVYRAIRQGLMQAENVILEPWCAFSARTEISLAGKIIADTGRMGGDTKPPEPDGEYSIISGRAPASAIVDYAESLITESSGRIIVSTVFDGYEESRMQEQIISETEYHPERDTENTPDSVFCAKGAGFNVKWYDVPKYADT